MNDQQFTVIGRDARIKGEVSFENSARILGVVEGSISSQGEVQVGEGSSCKASIDAARILVEGLVEGNLVARERVELGPKARVTGDIITGTLAVSAGATFSGHVRVGPTAAKEAPMVETRPTRLDEPAPGVGFFNSPPQVRAGWVGVAKVGAS